MGIFDSVKTAFAAAPASTLTAAEVSRYHTLKQTIRDGIKAWHKAAAALAEIRERQLYRDSHPTFKAFCEHEIGLTDHRVRQMLDAATIWEEVSRHIPTGSTIPATPPMEQSVKELKALPPEERPAAYAAAAALEADAAGKPATPKPRTVRRVVEASHAKAGRRGKPKPITIRVPGASVTIRWNSKGTGDAAAALAAAAAWIARGAGKAA
jgi:hypothetical protein